ncbi:hypothetical protein MLD38_033904 [Melastoma candidum]|uniref:Uncharacterized protein n=1 Tax=Melastoma candidum TaxID=119954 RepID=A0ACB9M8U0_9MYRT|nr:hypothetical protein MLD38_033904 [Melastoma candidum]
MKFGKEFTTHLEETLPEWRDKFLCYKPLKKLLKQVPSSAGNDLDAVGDGPPVRDRRPDWFVRLLIVELEKFNDFYVDKEEEFVIRFQELKERIERVKEISNSGGEPNPEGGFSQQMMEIRKDFVNIHGEMVLLKNYSSLNFAGIVKIVKKYDKRTGGALSLHFTQLAVRQPFFTTEPLTRLVRECEENLEVLFPLQAEVVESTSPAHSTGQHQGGSVGTSQGPSASVGEETLGVYRGTLAAMRTIQGLKRASSTYNPLSISSFYSRQEDDSDGALTAAGSDPSSPSATAMQSTDDADQAASNHSD